MQAAPRRLRISELARRADVSHATIQHYVREGLLPAPAKTGRTMAYYDESCVARIKVIKELQRRYLPLDVIRRLLADETAKVQRAGAPTVAAMRRKLHDALEPAERALSPEAIVVQLGISREVLADLEELGVLSSRPTGDAREREYPPGDVAVLRALGKLAAAGLSEAAGFDAKDVAAYRDAVRALVATEMAMFTERAKGREDPDFFRLGIAAATCATDLIVALRQKIIADAVASLPERED